MAYKVSEKYKELRYSGDNDNQLYLEYDGINVENASLITENLRWERRILDNGSKTLTLDNFVSQTMEISIRNFEVNDPSKEFYVKIGSMVDGAYEYVPLGYYHIKANPSTANGKTTYKLTDRSTNFDVYIDLSKFIEQNGGKITKLQAVQEYCRQCKVEFATPNFMGANEEIGIYDNTITARIHMSYFCEDAGCIATIGRDGKLYFIPLVKPNANNTHIIPEKILNNSMNNSKDSFKISKVLYEGALMPFEKGDDTKDTLFINTSNPYISKQEDIDRIYNQVVGLKIDNVSTSSIIGDPSIDPWDYIQYTHTDDEGNILQTFTSLAQYTLEFNGAFKQMFETSIDRQAKKINSTKNTPNDKYNRLTQEIDAVNASLRVTAEKVEDIEKDTTTSKTTEGNPIEIIDAGEYPLESIGIKGKNYQDGIPTPTSPKERKTVQGITNHIDKKVIKNNESYNFTIGSIPSLVSTTNRCSISPVYAIEVESNTTYTFKNKEGWQFSLGELNANKLVVKSYRWSSSLGYTFTTSSTTRYICINFGLKTNESISDIQFDEYINYIQLEDGLIVHNTFPYGRWLEQIAIEKNKYNKDNYLENYYYDGTGNKAIDNSHTYNNQKYVPLTNKLNFSFDELIGDGNIRLCEYEENGTFIKRTLINTNRTITLSNKTYYVIWSVNESSSTYFKKLQIEEGEITSYEEYKENSALIDMNIYDDKNNIIGYHELDEINNINDDFLNGILTKKIRKIILDGTESSWLIHSNTNNNIHTYFKEFNDLKINSSNAASNYFHYVDHCWDISNKEEGQFAINYKSIYFNSTLATLDEFKKWLSNNPIEVSYELAEPKTYQLNYEILKLHKGYNYITLNDNLYPNINLEYLIDSKFNETYVNQAEFKIKSDEISFNVSKKISSDDGGVELASLIRQTAELIFFKANNFGWESLYSSMSTDGKFRAISGSIGGWNIEELALYKMVQIGTIDYQVYIQPPLGMYGEDSWIFSCQKKTSDSPDYIGTFVVTLGGDVTCATLTVLKYLTVDNDILSNEVYCNYLYPNGNTGLTIRSGSYYDYDAGPESIWFSGGNNITLNPGGGAFVRIANGSSHRINTTAGSESSLNLKENIQIFSNDEYNAAIELLRNIDIYNYDYKYNIYDKLEDNKDEYGFIIDYVEENSDSSKFFKFIDKKAKVTDTNCLDEIYASEHPDDTENIINYKEYDDKTLVKYLLTVCKGQQRQIDNLIKRVESLEGDK